MENDKLIEVLTATLYAYSAFRAGDCLILARHCAEELRRAGFAHEKDPEKLKRWLETNGLHRLA